MHAVSHSKTLGRRLFASFGAVLFLTLAGSGIGVWSLYRVDEATREALEKTVTTERLVADAYRLQAINAARYKAMALSSEPEVGEILTTDIEETANRYAALLNQLAARLETSPDRTLLERTNATGRDFQVAVKELLAARDSNLTERIRNVYSQRFQPSATALLQAVAEMARSQRLAIDAAGARIADVSRAARLALMVFSATALLLGGLLTLWLLRGIFRPIRLASETAARVSRLDLRQEIAGHSRDEAGQLLLMLGAMQDALRQLVSRVNDSAQGVHISAGEIARGNSDLSTRTEEAAFSLQQTAAALEQVTRNLQLSTSSAATAKRTAQAAVNVAVQGGEVMAQIVSTMRDIDSSSRKVMDITGVIDSIAFQSNILALNAAVEAARAGGAGRGFAVVAAEVRQLATRSAAAANEIKTVIANSMRSVEAGAQLVDGAGQSMTDIVDSIRSVAGAISDIATASHDQARDIGQVNSAVSRLDRMTQENSALVEESAAASEALHQRAQDLAGLINRFLLPQPQAVPSIELSARAAPSRRGPAIAPAHAAYAAPAALA